MVSIGRNSITTSLIGFSTDYQEELPAPSLTPEEVTTTGAKVPTQPHACSNVNLTVSQR